MGLAGKAPPTSRGLELVCDAVLTQLVHKHS